MFNEGLTSSRSGEFNTLEFNQTPTAGLDLFLSDTGDGSDALSSEWERRITDTLAATAAAIGSGTFTYTLTDDSAEATDGILYVLTLFASDSGVAADALSVELVYLLADELVATGTVSSQLNAIVAVAVAFAIADSIVHAYDHSITDTADVGDQIAATVQKIVSVLATAEASASISNTVTLLATAAETGQVTDALSSTAVLYESLVDGANIVGVINIDGDQYTVYTVNATTGGVTEYQNFPFNSFAYLADHDILLGAKTGGVYRITGTTDDGSAITGRIKTGQLGFGSPYSKRVEYAGIGYTSDGQIVLKAIVVNDGRKREHWYKLTPTADAAREGRINLGLGLRSRYWQFELTSSADFEITDMELYPLVLSRRGGA